MIIFFPSPSFSYSFPFQDNFFYVHNSYIHPNFIRDNDNVTLFGTDEHHSWYCVTAKDADVYDLESSPFCFISQVVILKINPDYFSQNLSTSILISVLQGSTARHPSAQAPTPPCVVNNRRG